MRNIVDQETCKQCCLCVEVCPCNILGVNEKKEVWFIPERESICLECGQCMAVCPTGSVKIAPFSYGKELFDLPENNMTHGMFMDFLAHRRSVRNFKDKPVPRQTLEKILDAVALAPFGSAPDAVHITVVDQRRSIEQALPFMAQFLDNIVQWMESGVARFMIKRKKGLETFNTIQNHLYPIAKLGNYKLDHGDRITRNAPAMLIFHADRGAEEHTNNAMIYATYAMLAAHSLGLGATMIGLVPAAINKDDRVRKIFQVPGEHEAIISVILGFKKYRYKRGVQRKKSHVNWVG